MKLECFSPNLSCSLCSVLPQTDLHYILLKLFNTTKYNKNIKTHISLSLTRVCVPCFTLLGVKLDYILNFYILLITY